MGCECAGKELGTNKQGGPASLLTRASTASPRPLPTTELPASYDPADDHLGTARPSAQPPRTPSGSRTIPIPTALSACPVASRAQPTACNRRNPARSPTARTGSRLHTASNRPGSRGGARRRKPRLLGRPTTTLKGPRPNSRLSSYDPVV